jgi:hypothetical protein
MGWFYDFKLHLLINHIGEIISLKIPPGNTNDRTPIPELCKNLYGRLYADKGHIGKKLSEKLPKILSVLSGYSKTISTEVLMPALVDKLSSVNLTIWITS